MSRPYLASDSNNFFANVYKNWRSSTTNQTFIISRNFYIFSVVRSCGCFSLRGLIFLYGWAAVERGKVAGYPGRYQSKQGPQPCLLRDGDTSRRSGWEGPNPSLIPEKDFQAQAVHQESSVLPSCPKSSWVLRECVSGVGRVMGWAARGVGRAGAPCPRPALIPCLNLTGCVFSQDLSWLSLSWMGGTNALQRVLWLWPAGPMQLNVFYQLLSLCHSATSDSHKNAQNENIYFSFLSSGQGMRDVRHPGLPWPLGPPLLGDFLRRPPTSFQLQSWLHRQGIYSCVRRQD